MIEALQPLAKGAMWALGAVGVGGCVALFVSLAALVIKQGKRR